MAGGWYYAHDDTKLGPFSGEQLKELAADGTIMLTDTVWKAGVEQGVLASRIKNLFAPADDAHVLTAEVPRATSASIPAATLTAAAAQEAVLAHEPPKAPPPIVKKGLARALKGADIVGQDGAQAKYRMKCQTCGHKDASCRTVRIANKTTNANFFCPKCKKKQDVVIQCRTG